LSGPVQLGKVRPGPDYCAGVRRQVATNPNPPDPTLDCNTYWAEVQAQQQYQGSQQ
jgi:hypothetical protein